MILPLALSEEGGDMRLFSTMFLLWTCYYSTIPFLDWVCVKCSHKVLVERNHFVPSFPCRVIYFYVVIVFLFLDGMDLVEAKELKQKAFAKPPTLLSASRGLNSPLARGWQGVPHLD